MKFEEWQKSTGHDGECLYRQACRARARKRCARRSTRMLKDLKQ